MSFAAKPFSAASQQSASYQRTTGWRSSTRSPRQPLQQRRLIPGRDVRAVSSGRPRLAGWSDESQQRWTQAETTFEFWCAPSSRRRLTTVSRPASPTEAALALIVLPVSGFACPFNGSSGGDLPPPAPVLPPPASIPSEQASPPPPSTPGSSNDAADEEVAAALVQPTSGRSTPKLQQLRKAAVVSMQTATQQQQQQPRQQQQQQRPSNRPVSTGPTDQLLRLVRLSYTHSDLSTRRLLKSSLLHRSRPDPIQSTTVPAAKRAGLGITGGPSVNLSDDRSVDTNSKGLLTRRRFPMPTPIGMRAAGEQPPLRLWSRDLCLSLPPLIPN